MHPCMTFGARFGRLMACRVVVLLWCRGHVLLQGGDLPSPAALRRSVGAANPDAKKKEKAGRTHSCVFQAGRTLGRQRGGSVDSSPGRRAVVLARLASPGGLPRRGQRRSASNSCSKSGSLTRATRFGSRAIGQGDIPLPVKFDTSHTNPKRKRGKNLPTSLALRVGVVTGRERYRSFAASGKRHLSIPKFCRGDAAFANPAVQTSAGERRLSSYREARVAEGAAGEARQDRRQGDAPLEVRHVPTPPSSLLPHHSSFISN